VHGGSQAAPLIASVLKEVYKGEGRTANAKRAQRVEPPVADPAAEEEDRSN
jgi:hypothetical protein